MDLHAVNADYTNAFGPPPFPLIQPRPTRGYPSAMPIHRIAVKYNGDDKFSDRKSESVKRSTTW